MCQARLAVVVGRREKPAQKRPFHARVHRDVRRGRAPQSSRGDLNRLGQDQPVEVADQDLPKDLVASVLLRPTTSDALLRWIRD
jgi:hypothetical protein